MKEILKGRPVDGIFHRIPLFSADLADNLKDGSVKSVMGIQEITGPKTVMLTDGTVLEDIDAIIFCSGYDYPNLARHGNHGHANSSFDASGPSEQHYSSKYQCLYVLTSSTWVQASTCLELVS